jgi:hypothetical protein
MTTNVPKGANRAAAAQRTRKHAQRTPLPPRPGVIEDAREVLAEVASSNGEEPTEGTWSKATAFAAGAIALGWEAVTEARSGSVEVIATRGNETIVQSWHDGVWSYDASVYAFGDRSTKPRNASGARKLLSRSVGDAEAETSKVASNKHFRKAEPKDLAVTLEKAQKRLPFDPDLDTDEVVLAALSGQSLVWYNRISRGQDSAIVGRSKSLRMTLNEKGQRVVNWCCPVTGFRSCLVTAIIKVGRGRLESAKAETMKVLVDA